MKTCYFKRSVIALSILIFLSMILYLSWGSFHISFVDIIKTFFNKGDIYQTTTLIHIRLPRMIVAIMVAIALATAGALLQSISRNELVDSSIIGINAGAAFFAVLYITYASANYYSELKALSIYVLPFMALLGSIISATIVYKLSKDETINTTKLLLIGIGMNAALNALIMFVTYKGGINDYNRILTWTSGSLWGSGYQFVLIIVPVVSILFAIVLSNYKKLDILNFTNEHATALGLDVDKEVRKLLAYAVMLAATATAFSGNIGFLGMLAPNIAKKLVGRAHRKSLIISAMVSVVIILVADAMARNLFSPIEIPVGIIISIIGVPYFIYLLVKEK